MKNVIKIALDVMELAFLTAAVIGLVFVNIILINGRNYKHYEYEDSRIHLEYGKYEGVQFNLYRTYKW